MTPTASKPRVPFLLAILAAALASLVAASACDASKESEARRRVDEPRRLLALGRWAEAEDMADSLAARFEGERDELALAEAIDVRVDALRSGGRTHLSELPALAERALAIREERLPRKHPDRVASLERLALVRLDRRESAIAESLLSAAVEQRREAGDPRLLGIALGRLADAQRAGKNFDRARETAHLAQASVTGKAPADTAARVTIAYLLGQILSESGRSEEARRELESALALAAASAHPDSVEMARGWRHLARALVLEGDLVEAGGALRRALAVQNRVLGPDHPELAWTHYVATFWTSMAGDFVACRRHAERAVAIRQAVFGPDHPLVATALMALGGAMRNLGDMAGALPVLQRAVEIQRQAQPPNPADLATALTNLSSVYIELGQGQRAREGFEEAVAIREKVFGPGRGASFWTGTRLGHAMLVAGDAAAAQAQLEQVIASPMKRNPFDLADALQILGSAAYANGRFALADSAFDRAFAVHDSALGISSPRTLESLALRAAVRWRVGRREEALADAHRVEEGSRQALRLMARNLSEEEALDFQRIRGSGLSVLLALAGDAHGVDDAERARILDAVVRSRLVVLDELADENQALPRGDPALEPMVREVEDARSALSRVLVEGLRGDAAADSVVTEAHRRRDAAERALAERSAAFRRTARRADAALDSIRLALPGGCALVSFVRTGAPDDFITEAEYRPGASRDSAASWPRYVALVLRPDRAWPQVVRLGAAPELEPLLERWAEACATPPPSDPKIARAAERRTNTIGRAVREKLWDPLAPQLSGADRVFVVADGAIGRINLLALPDERGVYLAEKRVIVHRLTAERDLLPWESARKGRGVLALGGADFESASGPPVLLASASPFAASPLRSAVADSIRIRFGALPETAVEANEVAELWRRWGRREQPQEVLELVGAEASEAAFKRLAPGRRVLHIATHGFALGANGGSVLTRDGTRGVGQVAAATPPPRWSVQRQGPLLSGLALAGANAAADSSREDGFLTAEEITSLDLRGTEWAVLSACETGLTDPDQVEAVQGLHRAFRRAGLRTVIVSLWGVNDAATREWMKSLYQARLVESLDTAAAVRAACREHIKSRRARGLDTHPFYWAAFVAAGDWR